MVVGKLYQKDSQIYRRCKLVKFKTSYFDSCIKITKFNECAKFAKLVFTEVILLPRRAGLWNLKRRSEWVFFGCRFG